MRIEFFFLLSANIVFSLVFIMLCFSCVSLDGSAVVSSPRGPTASSEFEHSSIPATIKKMFNITSNFLTHRDAWAGTFEQVVGELTSPRTDCPGMRTLV